MCAAETQSWQILKVKVKTFQSHKMCCGIYDVCTGIQFAENTT